MEKEKDPFGKAELILKSLRGELTPQESEELNKWLEQNKDNAAFLEAIKNEESLNTEIDFFSSLNTEKAWQNIESKTTRKNEREQWWQDKRPLKYAAIFLAFILSAITVYKFNLFNKNEIVASVKPKLLPNDVAPGSEKAKLTLADGTELLLEETADGLVREENGVKVIKQKGQVVYQFAGKTNVPGAVEFNVISTPKGGQYQLILPDGTKVWLNAATQLRFPTAFTGRYRQVELTGEGYFEVAKNKNQPFIVEANHSKIEVLGTHFNVLAYANESATKTSLLEGSVKVSNITSNTIIKPGQQAIVALAAPIKTVEADLEQVVAWKDGYFQFNNEEFKTIAAQLERWYDVDLIIPASMATKQFAGAIPRNTNLSQVLKMLELSGSVKFKIEERRIMVLAKE